MAMQGRAIYVINTLVSRILSSKCENTSRSWKRCVDRITGPSIFVIVLLIILVFSFGMASGVNAACVDTDLDGYGNPGDVMCTKGSAVDCDDTDPLVYPLAVKICDGKDNNCDGLKDFGTDEDKDHDGVAVCANDCDDTNPNKYPGNYEIYNTPQCFDTIDNDCNYKTDMADPTCYTPCMDKDADGYGLPGTIYCASGSATNDCNDRNAAINPGLLDNDCNGVDNDCDGLKDEAFVVVTTSCGVGACAATGQNQCQNGVTVNTCVLLPVGMEGPVGAPSCSDGIDNNCNGTIDGADGFCMDVCMDGDGDGYGANGASVCPVPLVVDCDDANANVNPSVTDSTCNGVDENCSGANDEGYVPPATSCGVGGCARAGELACQAGAIVDTCTAGTPVIEGPLGRPTCTDNIDNNCDGLTDMTDPNCQVSCIDRDNDGSGNPGDASCPKGSKTDCNDNDLTTYPGAPKLCDGKDNNCDGIRDFQTDVDQDGDGVPRCANDCDDTNAAKFPGNYEIYQTAKCSDTIDNDCNYKIDMADPACYTPCIDKDADGYGKPGTQYCTSGSSATDCNDANAAINPGMADAMCNGVDNDCDGLRDEDFVSSPTTCGIGECANSGQTNCVSGVLGNTCVPLPAGFEGPFGSPSCNDGKDNDCNGYTDISDTFSCASECFDFDGDGYGNGSTFCQIPLLVDCDDTNPNMNPGVTDATCNGVDENCSGTADDGYVPTPASCGVGACARTGQNTCQSGAIVNTCVPGTTAQEGPLGQPSCGDGIDNNCNGLTDLADLLYCGVTCIDLDNDNYGNPGDATCPAGNKTDCNDNDNTVYPGATKLCDGKDNNCDGIKDFATDEDWDADGVPRCAGDCDDRDPNRSQLLREAWDTPSTCNDAIDNDCDLRVDGMDVSCVAPTCTTKTSPRNGAHIFDLLNQGDNSIIMTSCTWCHQDSVGNDMRPKCQRCHADPADASDPLNGVLKQQYSLNPPYGFGTAKNVKGHSSSIVGTTYGNWGPTCLTCHNPHLQEQNAKFGTTYGKYIKEYVCFDNTANGGGNFNELIRFTAASGPGSFADGPPANENICEMCHTRTAHNIRDGSMAIHNDSANCMPCHEHNRGFAKPEGAPSSTINNPATGVILSSASANPYTISGTAVDNVSVQSIGISTNGGTTWNPAVCTGCGTTSATWTYSWTLPSDGPYTIISRATDSAFNIETPGAGNTVTVHRAGALVTSTSPVNGETGVPVDGTVTINWNEAMDCATISTTTVSISPAVGWTRTSCSGSQAVFTASGQTPATSYTVTIAKAAKDIAGNPMDSVYLFIYTTAF